MSDNTNPSMDAKPGKFYVDQDSDMPGDDVLDIRYTNGTTLVGTMSEKLGPGLPTLKPLSGRQRIK